MKEYHVTFVKGLKVTIKADDVVAAALAAATSTSRDLGEVIQVSEILHYFTPIKKADEQMTMIEVVSPSLDQYMDQVRVFAFRYLGDEDKWFKLRPEDFTDGEEDRDEFSFIRMALWDKLMEREF